MAATSRMTPGRTPRAAIGKAWLINKTRAAVQRRTAALCSYFRLVSLFKNITASTMTPMTSTMLTIPMTMMAESSSTK